MPAIFKERFLWWGFLALLPACLLPLAEAEDAAWVREQFASRMGKGFMALRQGDAVTAAENLCWAARRGLNSARANLGCGRALIALREPDEAIPHLELASQLDPENLGIWVCLGDADLAAGRLDSARVAYYHALKLRVDHSPAYDGLARLAIARGDKKAALEFFAKALEANPADARTRLHRGQLHLEAHRFDQARKDIEQAARLRPDDAEVQLGLARILLQSGLPNQALAAARKALEIRPKDARIPAVMAATFLRMKAWSEAEQNARRAVGLDPDLSDARWALGEVLGRTGRLDEAIEVLVPPHPERLLGREVTKLAAARKTWIERKTRLGQLDAMARREQAAIPEMLELAEALLETDRKQRAAALAIEVSQRSAVSWDQIRQAARILFRAGHALESATLLERIDAAGRATSVDILNLGVAREITGDPAGAEQAYRRALSMPDPPVQAYGGLARLALARGDYDDVAAELKALLAAHPPPDDAARASAALERLEGSAVETGTLP